MHLSMIRHLQTPWNEKGIMQGSQDISISPMTDKVLSAVNSNQVILRDISFDVVLASPYVRTQQTALAYGFSDCVIEPLLKEVNFGQFEGKPKQGMIDACGEAWYDDPRSLILGEPLTALEERVKQFLSKYSTYNAVLAFGHGSWMRALKSVLECGDISKMNRIEIINNELMNFNLTKEVLDG